MAHPSADPKTPPSTALPTLLPAPGSKPPGRPPRPPRSRHAVPDELAAMRRRKAQQRMAVARYVDHRIDALECEEAYTVSRLYVLVAGSLAPGHLLSLVARWSDAAFAATGTPWVRRSLQDWINHSGLAEEDWIAARELLREQGLIHERRRFDLDQQALCIEVAFVPDVFAQRVAAVREEVREEAWERVRAGDAL